MKRPKGKGRHKLADEIAFLLSLSNDFSVAFGIKRDRAQQWQFLGVLLSLEQNSIISYAHLLESATLKKIVEPGKRSYNVFYWVNTFIAGFSNDDGRLTDVLLASDKNSGKRARIQAFRFNENFDRAACSYMRSFVRKNCPDLQVKADRLSPSRCSQIFKEMFRYLTNAYLPLWGLLMEGLSKAAIENGYSADGLPGTMLRGTNWVVLFLFWQEYLLHGATSWDTIDINQRATDVLRLVEPKETDACLRAFTDKGGPHLLTRTKEKTLWRYHFNPMYEQPLREYSESISAVRLELRKIANKALH
jgi:hypothetical protein